MQLRIAIATLALMTMPVWGQDHAMHDAGAAAPDLPEVCLTDATGHEDMPMPGMASGGDAAHQDLMDGMDKMNADMMAGGTAADLDVAFVCSMIPHHRGAIDMAKAELAHGDDPWARQLAEQVIAAQEREIAQMLEWLQGQK